MGNDMSVNWFSLVYAAALLLACGAAALWRQWMRRRGGAEVSEFRLLDQYEHTWLQYGRAAAVERAVVNLLRRENLTLDPNDSQRVHVQDFEGVHHPLEVDVMDAITRYGSLPIAHVPHATVTGATPCSLARAGLIPHPVTRWLSFLPAMGVVPGIVAVGVVRVMQSIAADQPVAPVVVLTLCGATAFARLCLPAPRTRRGDAVLSRLAESAPARERVSAQLAVRLHDVPTRLRQVA